jgi:hypothetical protein
MSLYQRHVESFCEAAFSQNAKNTPLFYFAKRWHIAIPFSGGRQPARLLTTV